VVDKTNELLASCGAQPYNARANLIYIIIAHVSKCCYFCLQFSSKIGIQNYLDAISCFSAINKAILVSVN